MDKKGKKKKIKKVNIVYVIIGLAILIMIVGVAFIRKGLTQETYEGILPVYSYEANKSSDYKVLLKPNDYYATTTLPAGMQYASPAISTINSDLHYDFSSTDLADIAYTYSITADIIGNVDSEAKKDNEIWNRRYVIQAERSNKIESDYDFTLDDNINIDYNYFNELVKSYEQTYGFSINATLKVRMNIEYTIDLVNKNVKTEKVNDYIEFSMPLNDTVVEVKNNYTKKTNKDVLPKSKQKTEEKFDMTFVIWGSGLIVLGFLVIILNINKKKYSRADLYHRNVNTVLKEYSDLIVTVTNKPNLHNLKTMQLTILDDLIDVAEQSNSNIILYERIKNKECDLYVIYANYVYIYTITHADLRESKEK